MNATVVQKYNSITLFVGRRCWKRQLLPLFYAVAYKNERLVLIVFLHQSRVFESFQHGSLTLNSCIRYIANLVTVEGPPVLPEVLAMECHDIPRLDKVDESVTTVTLVLEIDWQIEEINHSRTIPVLHKLVQQHLLRVFVGNISYHQRGPGISAMLHGVEVQDKVRVVPPTC